MPNFSIVASVVIAFSVAVAATAVAAEPNGGYYEGLSILYPYDPVFCDKDSGLGSSCFGMPGAHLFLPLSAPLPPGENYCKWGGIDAIQRDGNDFYAWYQWKPRTIALRSGNAKVCYLEDRGAPWNDNYLPRK